MKKKIVCVVPPYYLLIESKNNRIIPSMHYVSQVIYEAGYDVVLINGDAAEDSFDYADRFSIIMNSWLFDERYAKGHSSFDKTFEEVIKHNPDVVIISAGDVLIPTTEFGNCQSCSKLAQMIKEYNPKIICIGYGNLLKNSKSEHNKYLDAMIVGEAEDEILEIIEGKPKGYISCTWVKDLDNLPMLQKDYIETKIKDQDFDYVMSMRGCGNHCSFCMQPKMRGKNVSRMSVERFKKELKYRIEHYHINNFYFSDMVFLPQNDYRKEEMLKMLKKLKSEYGNDFVWRCEQRVDSLSESDMINFQEAGCFHIKFGVESLNQKMLDRFHKQTTLEETYGAFENANKLGLETTAYILLGCPGFSDEDYRKMWYEVLALKANNYVVNFNVPYTTTKIYETLKEHLNQNDLFVDGEEGFIHTSLIMKDYWQISDETLKMYLDLNSQKDDNKYRLYKRKVVDSEQYFKNQKIIYNV